MRRWNPTMLQEPFGYRLDERVDETCFDVRGRKKGLLPGVIRQFILSGVLCVVIAEGQ